MELIKTLILAMVILLFIGLILLGMIGNVLDKIHYVLKEILYKTKSKNE